MFREMMLVCSAKEPGYDLYVYLYKDTTYVPYTNFTYQPISSINYHILYYTNVIQCVLLVLAGGFKPSEKYWSVGIKPHSPKIV